MVRIASGGVDPRSTRGQAYRLEIGRAAAGKRGVVRIMAATEIGARYGLRTLAQILNVARRPTHGNEWALPAMIVEDEPAFAVRGVMLDISRGRVPRMNFLYDLVDRLASIKINHLQMYMEHTFAYAGHEVVWRAASPMTPDEIRALDAYAAARGIELAANQNCFGHLTRWLTHPQYAHLAETHGEWVFDDGVVRVPRSGAFSLCPLDPGSLGLIDDLLGQLLPCFSSPRVNIGCDETFDVGYGRSRTEIERRGRAAVYWEFVRRVAAVARKHIEPLAASREHLRPLAASRRLASAQPSILFWADIALRYPESLDQMTDDMVPLLWGYEPETPFEKWIELIREATSGESREVWVCPGTSSWRSIIGRTLERRGNISAAARAGVAGRAEGFLITDWGDHGHRQQWPVALHGLADGANAGWNGDPSTWDARAGTIHLMDDLAGDAGVWLEALGDLDLELRHVSGPPDERGCSTPLRNASALFTDIESPLHTGPRLGTIEQWSAVRQRLESLGPPPTLSGPSGELLHQEMRHIIAVVEYALTRAVARCGSQPPDGDTMHRLQGALRDLIAEHRELWLNRSRPGGLDESCAYYENTLMAQ